jgi:hypothetical protein
MYIIKILKFKILELAYGPLLQILKTPCLLQMLCIVHYVIEVTFLISVYSHIHGEMRKYL